jgi:signal transduction histidine kinase
MMARLSQGMAHEVRNPLFAIQVTVSVLVKHFAASPDAQAHVDHILAHVKRLDDLVRSLIDLGESIGPDEIAESDLKTLLDSACEAARQEFAGRRVGFELEARSAPVILKTSARKMTLAFGHLLRNAAQASSDDSVVQIAYFQEPGACRITVRDRGPGIPELIRATLFEPFVTTRAGQPGMGLALAKHYIESLGGTITAENNDPGPGAVVTASLPLA